MATHFIQYLPNDILCKVDRAAMANSLETRIPFLDTHVMRLAWNMPREWKLNARSGKLALRQILKRYIPPELWERPKKGFGIPIQTWLRGGLRGWAEHYLLDRPQSVHALGLIDADSLGRLWKQFQSGDDSLLNTLWILVVLEGWLEHWRPEL